MVCQSSTAPATTDVSEIPGLKDLWAQTLGDPRVCVAVLDGPVDLTHPSLANSKLTQIETVTSGVADGESASQHGTHVASIIFAGHDGPIQGIAPQCRGLVVPIFRSVVGGSPVPCSQLDLSRAITQAVEAGANILNISGGQFSPSGTAHPYLADAVRNAANHGVLIVAAAGNQGCECLHVPGALPSVLAVGAMDSLGEPLEFSNWGEAYQTQGVLAPGENILGAVPGAGASSQTGTSYATPIVSGVAALMLSLQLQRGEKLDNQGVRTAIIESALGCEHQPSSDCRRVLAGRLHIPGLVTSLKQGNRTMSEPSATQLDDPSPVTETDAANPPTLEALAPDVETSISQSGALAPSPQGERPATATAADPAMAPPIEATSPDESGSVTASACGCGCGGGAPAQLVFALGQLGFDFGTEARRDSIMQHMNQPASPYDPHQLLAYLEENPWDTTEIIWTLNLASTPIYAVAPQGPFASEASQRIREFLQEQLSEGVERVSIPGWIVGKARLFNGQVVPVIHPVLRGMYSWTTQALVDAVCGKSPADNASKATKDTYLQKASAVQNFLRRIYDELRNFGASAPERAMNYSATNALLVSEIFEDAIKEEMDLDTIDAEPSPICRPGSECWDVKLTFFDPKKIHERARKVYRFCCDVSDPVPCMVGEVRTWFVR